MQGLGLMVEGSWLRVENFAAERGGRGKPNEEVVVSAEGRVRVQRAWFRVKGVGFGTAK